MLCDFHAHFYDEPGYASALVETAKNLGFDSLCIGAGQARYGLADNEEVLAQAESYPDLLIPFGHFSLGTDGPGEVEELARRGFRGLRVTAPPAPYDAPEFFPVYEAAVALGLPVVFHTGLLPPTDLDRATNVHAEWMRPLRLDTLARQLPALKIVGCRLGAPWYEEAAEILRTHPNVFFDLSGYTLRQKGSAFFRDLLGSESSSVLGQSRGCEVWSRLVFGTAVRHDEIGSVERDYQRLFRVLALPREVADGIMGGNAAQLLGLTQSA
jgi:predicted TIM-barrel fold metal-dependent hydrolase